MKAKHFLPTAFLAILCAAPAFAADTAEAVDTAERDAIVAELDAAVKAKQYDLIVDKALTLYQREDAATLKKPGKWSLPYMITEAKLRKEGKSDFASVKAQVAADREAYGFTALQSTYEYNVIFRLDAPEAVKGYVAAYREAGKTDTALYILVYNMIRSRQLDLVAAFNYAVECNAWKHIAGCLQAANGKKLSADDSGLLYKAINNVLDDPAQIVDLGFAKTTADRSLLNLYTTGKIDKDQFVSTLKKLYQRTYMGLSSDRDKWEPVIASIKSLIVNADKINDFGE